MTGTHGELWKVVFGMEYLVQSLEEHYSRLAADNYASAHLKTSIILALNKLEEYLGKTNRSAVWLATLVLNPKHKWDSIQALWGIGNKQSLLRASKICLQNLWISHYPDKVTISQHQHTPIANIVDSDREDDLFNRLLSTTEISSAPVTEFQDEYIKYINKEKDDDIRNSLKWWREYQNTYPNLTQMAFDLFAIPAMSSECERSFSKASYTISAQRSNLSNDIVEAGEVLRLWVSTNMVILSAPTTNIVKNELELDVAQI